MSMPPPASGGRPDQSVNPDSQFELAQSFNVLVNQISGLERVISNQTTMMERALSAQNRFAMGSVNMMGGQAQFSQSALNQIIASGGGGEASQYGLQQVTGVGALSSLEQGRAYLAQRVGSWMAGQDLYTPAGPNQSGGQGGQGPTVSQTGQQPGSAAPRPQQAQPQRLSGLAGYLYGGILPAQPGAQQAMGLKALQQAGARLALSGGSFQGIVNGLRHVPILGLGIDAVQGVADFYQTQREAGRQYQNIEGGTNLGAQTERLHSLAYQASMFGRMPEGAAAQAFGQVTAMGYNQAANDEGGDLQNRQSALNFIYGNYTNTGMSVDQSTQILSTASQNATVSLQTVATALKNLSDDAGTAGDNADKARQAFNSYFSEALGSGAANGAPGVAGALAGMQASYGKQFAGQNLRGELGYNQQLFMSGRYGISPAQVQSLMRQNPQEYARMLSGNNMQAIGTALTPEMMSDLRNMIAGAGGASALRDPAVADRIANEFLNKWQQVDPALTVQNLAAIINGQTGANISSGNIMSWIVNQVAGKNEAAFAGTAGHQGSFSAGNTSGAPQGRYGLAQGTMPHLGPGHDQVVAGQTWQSVLRDSSAGAQAANAYLAHESKSGQRSPVLEALLQNAPGGTQVQVDTKNGARVMSLAQALKFYPNEVASGAVRLFSSNGHLIGSTGTLTHGLTDPSANVTEETQQRAGSKQGLSMANWEKKHPGSVPKGRSVTVGLTQEAQRLLKILPTAGDQAAASGTVPTVPWQQTASR